jgi:hypothetical protein
LPLLFVVFTQFPPQHVVPPPLVHDAPSLFVVGMQTACPVPHTVVPLRQTLLGLQGMFAGHDAQFPL